MFKSKKPIFLIVFLSFVLIAIIVARYQLKVFTTDKIPLAEDISDKFIMTPLNEYSLTDKKIIISPDNTVIPGLPERIEIKIPYENKFTNFLWANGKDCNLNGILYKKISNKWTVVQGDFCSERNRQIPGKFFAKGTGDLFFVLITKDTSGTYRVGLNLLYGCNEQKSACTNNAVSYSPQFEITK